jgi:hypothetical protein
MPELWGNLTCYFESIELQPDKDNPNEKFLLVGDEGSLMSQTSSLIAINQMIRHRDIGTAPPPDTDIPSTEACLSQLNLLMQPYEEPPFSRRNPPGWRRVIRVPNVKSTATWAEIKKACGGVAGYQPGPWLATARLSSGRKICVYGATKEIAQTRAEELADLSTDTVVGLYVGYAAKTELKPKTPYQVFPAYVVATRLFQDSDGRKYKNGARYREESRRFPLWVPDAPSGLTGSIFNWYPDDDMLL